MERWIGNIDEHLNGVLSAGFAKSKLSLPYSLHAESINTVQRFFVEETRLGIPVDFTNEGIRGLAHTRATSFPSQLGVASAWDRSLVDEIGRITGREARILGYTNVYSPILDLARDPRWGRTEETYSEDPYLAAELGKHMVKALQAEHVVYGPSELDITSVLDGIRQKLGPAVQVHYAKGSEFVDAAFPESEILPVPPTDQEQAEIDKARNLAKQVDAVVLVLGENRELVEESRSRTNLDLTGFQLKLAQAVHEAGKPTVAVFLNGRPLTINWIDRYIPAVVEAWWSNEFCGAAIADVLFGDHNPSGKLTITFPKSVGQIPYNFPFKRGSQVRAENLNAQEKKTMVNGALYPFGHGRSYTTFRYSNLVVTPSVQRPDGTISISLDIENTGSRSGVEIVQLYLVDEVTSVVYCDSVLRGFERIPFNPGEKKTVRFTLNPQDLMLLNRDMKWVVEPGRFQVRIGASSEDIRLRGTFEIR